MLSKRHEEIVRLLETAGSQTISALAEALVEYIQPIDYAIGQALGRGLGHGLGHEIGRGLGHDIGNSFRLLHHRAKVSPLVTWGTASTWVKLQEFLILDRIGLSHS